MLTIIVSFLNNQKLETSGVKVKHFRSGWVGYLEVGLRNCCEKSKRQVDNEKDKEKGDRGHKIDR